jgi:hypothetical protein
MTRLKAKKPAMLAGAKPKGSMPAFIGRLKGQSWKVASLEEIGEAAAKGWAAGVRRGGSRG